MASPNQRLHILDRSRPRGSCRVAYGGETPKRWLDNSGHSSGTSDLGARNRAGVVVSGRIYEALALTRYFEAVMGMWYSGTWGE